MWNLIFDFISMLTKFHLYDIEFFPLGNAANMPT